MNDIDSVSGIFQEVTDRDDLEFKVYYEKLFRESINISDNDQKKSTKCADSLCVDNQQDNQRKNLTYSKKDLVEEIKRSIENMPDVLSHIISEYVYIQVYKLHHTYKPVMWFFVHVHFEINFPYKNYIINFLHNAIYIIDIYTKELIRLYRKATKKSNQIIDSNKKITTIHLYEWSHFIKEYNIELGKNESVLDKINYVKIHKNESGKDIFEKYGFVYDRIGYNDVMPITTYENHKIELITSKDLPEEIKLVKINQFTNHQKDLTTYNYSLFGREIWYRGSIHYKIKNNLMTLFLFGENAIHFDIYSFSEDKFVKRITEDVIYENLEKYLDLEKRSGHSYKLIFEYDHDFLYVLCYDRMLNRNVFIKYDISSTNMVEISDIDFNDIYLDELFMHDYVKGGWHESSMFKMIDDKIYFRNNETSYWFSRTIDQ
jgi:hypothetical protein